MNKHKPFALFVSNPYKTNGYGHRKVYKVDHFSGRAEEQQQNQQKNITDV